MAFRIYLMDRVSIEDHQTMLDERQLVGRQGRLVFAYLAWERFRVVTRDELANVLWPEDAPPSWDRALNAVISKLRAALASLDRADLSLVTSFGTYQLRLPDRAWIDVEEAARAIDLAENAMRQRDADGAFGWGQVTFHITRRQFLPGDDGPWVTQRREELSSLLVRAHECISDSYLLKQQFAMAARHAEQALSLDPYRETSYQRLMQAHHQSGNRAQALRVYEHCRRLLANDLGVSPAPETESLHRQILEAP